MERFEQPTEESPEIKVLAPEDREMWDYYQRMKLTRLEDRTPEENIKLGAALERLKDLNLLEESESA